MKTLSIQDAQKYFSELNPRYYLFSTENQKKHLYPNCISMVTRYTEVIFSMFTNRICFKNGENMLCFSSVKYIKIDETPCIGTPFYIICDDNDRKSKENVFTFLAD